MKYCDQCGIELIDSNNTDGSDYCHECEDDFLDDGYEDFDA